MGNQCVTRLRDRGVEVDLLVEIQDELSARIAGFLAWSTDYPMADRPHAMGVVGARVHEASGKAGISTDEIYREIMWAIPRALARQQELSKLAECMPDESPPEQSIKADAVQHSIVEDDSGVLVLIIEATLDGANVDSFVAWNSQIDGGSIFHCGGFWKDSAEDFEERYGIPRRQTGDAILGGLQELMGRQDDGLIFRSDKSALFRADLIDDDKRLRINAGSFSDAMRVVTDSVGETFLGRDELQIQFHGFPAIPYGKGKFLKVTGEISV